jgi:hypothetical protein
MFFVGERHRDEARLDAICDSRGKKVIDLESKTVHLFKKGNPSEYFQVHIGESRLHTKTFWVKKEELQEALGGIPSEKKIELITNQYLMGSWKDSVSIDSYIEMLNLKDLPKEDYREFFELRSRLDPHDQKIFDGLALLFPKATWPKIFTFIKSEAALHKNGVKILAEILKDDDVKEILKSTDSRLLNLLANLEPDFLIRVSPFLGNLENLAKMLGRYTESSLITVSFLSNKLFTRQLEDFIKLPFPKEFIEDFLTRVKTIEDKTELNAVFSLVVIDPEMGIEEMMKIAEEFRGLKMDEGELYLACFRRYQSK